MKLCSVLDQVRHATNKTKLYISYDKLGIRVAERLKTLDVRKFGNIKKISNLGGVIN